MIELETAEEWIEESATVTKIWNKIEVQEPEAQIQMVMDYHMKQKQI